MSLFRIAENEWGALSTDIANNKITGLGVVGSKVYISDTRTWYVVMPDLTLSILGGESAITYSPSISTAAAISGQINVSVSGAAVQGPNAALTNGVYIKALSTNAGVGYVGNNGSGDVDSTNGFELASGSIILLQVTNVNQLWFDGAEANTKFCWIKA